MPSTVGSFAVQSSPPWPALGAWGAVATGCLAASATPGLSPTIWLIGAVAAAIAVCALRGARAWTALAIAGALLSGGWFSLRIYDNTFDRFAPAPAGRAIVVVEGVLLNTPEHGPPTPGPMAHYLDMAPVSRFTLLVDTIQDGAGSHRTKGKLLVRINETILSVQAGDRVQISGFYSAIAAPTSPGQPDARRWASQERILGRLISPGRDNIEKINATGSFLATVNSRWLRWRAALRARSSAWLDTAVAGDAQDGDPGRAVLSALLLGARDDDSLHDLTASMRRLGVAHLLSISGLHLGVLIWFAVVALRAVGVRHGIEIALVALLVVMYMIVVPARTPIIRAGVMSLAYLAAEATGRRHHSLAVLAWAGVGVLLWRPLDLFSPGYQLSFGVVAAIIILPPIVRQRLHPVTPERDTMSTADRGVAHVEWLLLVAVCAWAVAMPIVAFHFGIVSVFGAIASVILFPLVALTLGVGVVTILLAALTPSLAMLAGGVLTVSGRLLSGVAFAMDAMPGSSIRLPPVSVWWTIAALALAVWLLTKGTYRNRRDVALTALILIWLGSFALTPSVNRDVALRIDTLDVSDGACHLIRSGSDAALWDCGSRLLWLGQRDIPRTLRALGVWRVRTIILSHPNLDHYAAIPDIIGPLGVREVLIGEATIAAAEMDPAGPVAHLLGVLDREKVSVRVVRAGDLLKIGSTQLEFIHPRRHDAGPNANDQSLVALARVPTTLGERRVLFTGDIGRDAIKKIELAYPDLRVDVVEAPHHGSAQPRAIKFVEAIDPAIVIQSTGSSRVNDVRWSSVREGRAWFTTAKDGTIRIIIRTDGGLEASAFGRKNASRLIAESEKAKDKSQ